RAVGPRARARPARRPHHRRPGGERERGQGAPDARDRPAPGRSDRGGRMTCDTCLRRTWLVARLAGWIELARHEGKRLPGVLALSDDDLVSAVAPSERVRAKRQLEQLDLDELRDAYARAGLAATCRHQDGYPRALRDDRAAPPVV